MSFFNTADDLDDLDDDLLTALLDEFHIHDDAVEEDGTTMPAAHVADRDDALPARAHASLPECERVHLRLRKMLPAGNTLRFAQARHLAATQDGDDGVLIGATGSGKSLNMFVHAAADFADALAAGTQRTCRPVDLILIPMVNMGPAHEQAARRFFGSIPLDGVASDDVPAALYVARDFSHGGQAGGSSHRAASQSSGVHVCPQSHALLWHSARKQLESALCDLCGADLGPASGRWACANRTVLPECEKRGEL